MDAVAGVEGPDSKDLSPEATAMAQTFLNVFSG